MVLSQVLHCCVCGSEHCHGSIQAILMPRAIFSVGWGIFSVFSKWKMREKTLMSLFFTRMIIHSNVQGMLILISFYVIISIEHFGMYSFGNTPHCVLSISHSILEGKISDIMYFGSINIHCTI